MGGGKIRGKPLGGVTQRLLVQSTSHILDFFLAVDLISSCNAKGRTGQDWPWARALSPNRISSLPGKEKQRLVEERVDF